MVSCDTFSLPVEIYILRAAGLMSIGRLNMENSKNLYETLFVIDPRLSEEETKAMFDRFTGLIADNGETVKVDEWGRRRLAYPIEDQTEGHYVLVEFKSAPDFPAELERIFNITEGILRSIVIRKNEKKAEAEA